MDKLSNRVMALEGPDREIIERLDRSGECWLWTGKLDSRGRGKVWVGGKIKIHHRAVWEILVGPIPEGALLCHHCDNPTCANPAHLYVGDAKSNAADMFARKRHWTQKEPERARSVGIKSGSKNTWVRGASNPRAKLTEAQTIEIAQSTSPSREAARIYGVHATTIQRIRNGKLWNSQ